MTSSIAQFNIQFDPVEDRLQLRVLSTDDTEVRIWLTRRYVRLLLKVLKDQVSEVGKAAIENWGLEQAKQAFTANDDTSTNFDEEYLGTDDTQLPLGEEPILVTRIACREQVVGNLALVLGQENEGGMQMEMNLTDELSVNLAHMLLESAIAAEWDLAEKPVIGDFSDYIKGAVLH